MTYSLDLVPGATAMRTHALVQSSTMFATISEQFQQIETDVSLFLPLHRNLQAMDYYISEKGRRLTRLPYYWEDDVAAMWPEWKWDNRPPPSRGLRIFDFHPMYVGLNMQSMEPYRALKTSLGSTPLYQASKKQCEPYIAKGVGDRNFLEKMIGHIGAGKFKTISSVAREYRA